MAVYVMGYGLGRFWIEGLRIDPADELAGLRWNQWVALAAIVGGAVWLYLTRGRTWPVAADGSESATDLATEPMPAVTDPDVADPQSADPDAIDRDEGVGTAQTDVGDAAGTRPQGDGDGG